MKKTCFVSIYRICPLRMQQNIYHALKFRKRVVICLVLHQIVFHNIVYDSGFNYVLVRVYYEQNNKTISTLLLTAKYLPSSCAWLCGIWAYTCTYVLIENSAILCLHLVFEIISVHWNINKQIRLNMLKKYSVNKQTKNRSTILSQVQ